MHLDLKKIELNALLLSMHLFLRIKPSFLLCLLNHLQPKCIILYIDTLRQYCALIVSGVGRET